jgi:hypothetical protein
MFGAINRAFASVSLFNDHDLVIADQLRAV